MSDQSSKSSIDGNGNIVIQNVSGTTITINPGNPEELRQFLIDFSQRLSELPIEVVSLLEQKSKEMNSEIIKGANLYLTVLAEVSGHGVTGVSWGTTITNLTREIRYFNQPYFKVSPSFRLGEGMEHDTFMMMQRQGTIVRFPYRLEFGQIVDCAFPVIPNAFRLYEEINIEGAFIQAFVSTTIGEIYSSRQYPISKFVGDYRTTFSRQ